jgi:hypothetical protein
MAARVPSMVANSVPDGDVVHADDRRLRVAHQGLVHTGDAQVSAGAHRAALGQEVQVGTPRLVDDDGLLAVVGGPREARDIRQRADVRR